MKKSNIFQLGAISLVLLSTTGSWAAKGDSKAGQTFGGSTGLFVSPTAETAPARSVIGGMGYLSGNNALTPRLTVGVIEKLELGLAGNFESGTAGDGANIHAKYRVVDGETDVAIFVNAQMMDPGFAWQTLGLFTYGSVSNWQTTATLGYTIGPWPEDWNIDFSLGMQRIVTGSLPWLRMIVDFSNYSYLYSASSTNPGRGIINGGARAVFGSGKWSLNADLVFTDFFDQNVGIGLGANFLYRL